MIGTAKFAPSGSAILILIAAAAATAATTATPVRPRRSQRSPATASGTVRTPTSTGRKIRGPSGVRAGCGLRSGHEIAVSPAMATQQ